jgi:lipoate-protein ligase A
MVANDWSIEERQGAAGDLHRSWPATETEPSRRALAVCRVARPALVLGSTQDRAVVDPDLAEVRGIEVVRRRSGGGAVLVVPGDPVWVDAWVPRGDPLWQEDVGRAFDWFGDAWTTALTAVGGHGLSPHREGFAPCTRWSSLVCFGGVGTGEVVTADGRKVVGISQRRTRDGAWFHSAAVLHWDPAALLEVLVLPTEERAAAQIDLGGAAIGVADLVGLSSDAVIEAAAVSAALVAALPA